ncbi:UNVERIFIED_CONTAM: Gag-Pol polyprotein [Sesamum indicum]
MFAQQIGKTMEVYVDDMLVKSQKLEEHLEHLKATFAIMREYGMKLNPNKCTFDIGGGKFLGYMVSERGIEANPEKIEAILKLKSPTSLKEVQKLTGRIASLNRFISRSADRNLHFFKILKKVKGFEWTDECERAFQELKNYLKSPPLLANPKGDTLYLYLAVSDNAYPITTEVSGRMIKWAVELGEFDISYQSRTTEKAQILADFMIEISGASEDPGIWMLHVDGSSNTNKGGAGILIEGPGGIEIEVVVRLSFLTTNNEAEYEAVVLGLELAFEAGAQILEVLTDSQLVAMQIEGTYETREKSMTAYLKKAKEWMQRFSRNHGQENNGDDKRASSDLRVIRDQYGTQLYKRTVEGPLLKCLDDLQAKYVLREIHEGSCGNHSGARSLAQKVARQGYFWPTLMTDSKEFVRRCEKCQRYASQIHTPAVPMTPILITCPFDQWDIDILGPFPLARAQKKFVIVAVEYFSKWVEVEAVSKISEREVINFIWKNIVCRFGIPRVLISDNGTQFQGRQITSWLQELKIQQNFTAIGHPQANGQTEVTNRTILQHLKSRLSSKKDWSDELPGVLWVYRTTPRSSTGETPFSLVYGSEAVIPTEIGEESQRIMGFDPASNRGQRAFDLDTVEERRDAAQVRMMHHKSLMLRSHNKNLKLRSLQVGDLILKKAEVSKHVGKLDPNWEGPFKVVEIIRNGAFKLQDIQGKDLLRPWNIRNLRRFYV